MFVKQQALDGKLEAAVSSSEVFKLALAALVQRQQHLPLMLPPAWPFQVGLLPLAADGLPEDDAALLHKYKRSLRDYAAAGSADDDADADDADDADDEAAVPATISLSRADSAEALGDDRERVRDIGLGGHGK